MSVIDRARLQALVTPWQLLAATGATTLIVLVGFGNRESGPMTWRLRLAGIAVSASAAFFFDDPAATTVASSPTSLLTRRWHRAIGLIAALIVWWATATVLLRARFGVRVPGRLAMELAATVAVAVALALLLTRSSNHPPGMVGAVVAPLWFALGYLPRPAWMVVPPAPDAALGLLLGVVLASLALITIASLDAR